MKAIVTCLTVALAVIVAAFTPTAQATTLVAPAGGPLARWQRIADKSFLGTPQRTIAIVVGDCPTSPGAGGCIQSSDPYADDLSTVVWIAPRFMGTVDMPLVLMHELGHLVDRVISPTWEMTPTRRSFLRLLGVPPDTDWRADNPALSAMLGVAAKPVEAWADLFGACAERGLKSKGPILTNGYQLRFPAVQYNAVCALFAQITSGPGFDPPGAVPSGPITTYPNGDAGLCGRRPNYALWCGVKQRKLRTKPHKKSHRQHRVAG